MTMREASDRQFMRDLFAGPFRGHALLMDGPQRSIGGPGDYLLSDRPVEEWVSDFVRNYEDMASWGEAVGDDSVPYAPFGTNTGIFAAAFGCPLHVYEDSNAAAMPIVRTPSEADRLPMPSLDAPPLARYFALADLVAARLGPEAPLGVPDIQSPFDIAALIWEKRSFYLAMVDAPDAVEGLVEKCHSLLKAFLAEFIRRYPQGNFVHCPRIWSPPDLGCSLSEDEAGGISASMFERFCLPRLVDLSETFGGLFMHSCAAADHQYGGFSRIPDLRGLNRVFQAPGPRPAIEAFSGKTVLMVSWIGEDAVVQMLDMALPETRFAFNVSSNSLDDARRIFERLRERCPRSG